MIHATTELALRKLYDKYRMHDPATPIEWMMLYNFERGEVMSNFHATTQEEPSENQN